MWAARRVRVRRAALGSARAAAHEARTHQVGRWPRRPFRPGGRTPGRLAARAAPRSEVRTTTGAAHPRSAAPFYGGAGRREPPCQLEVALRPVLPDPQGWPAVGGARRAPPTPDPAT